MEGKKTNRGRKGTRSSADLHLDGAKLNTHTNNEDRGDNTNTSTSTSTSTSAESRLACKQMAKHKYAHKMANQIHDAYTNTISTDTVRRLKPTVKCMNNERGC